MRDDVLDLNLWPEQYEGVHFSLGFGIQKRFRSLSVLAVFATVLLLLGCNRKEAAIQGVMGQYMEATVEFTNTLCVLKQDPIKAGLSSGPSDALRAYADKLRAMDISACPDDFRTSFVNFYQQVDAFKTYSDSITGWRGVMKGFLNPMAIFSVPDNTDKAMKPLEDAGRELELVCVKYGLRFQ